MGRRSRMFGWIAGIVDERYGSCGWEVDLMEGMVG